MTRILTPPHPTLTLTRTRCDIPSEHLIVKAQPQGPNPGLQAQYAPCPIEELEEMIAREKPAVLFAPHVETSTGNLLPDPNPNPNPDH